MRNSKYTLIELLVTLAIIAILTSLLISAMSIVAERQKQIHCLDKMRSIGSSFAEFYDDHGYYPAIDDTIKNGGQYKRNCDWRFGIRAG